MLKYPCYVLHVKEGYDDREKSILDQFTSMRLAFEWILDHDIPDLTPDILAHYGFKGDSLRPAEISCSLKHITAWERIARSGAAGAFVLEDDVLLDRRRFVSVTEQAVAEFLRGGRPEGCISLGDGCALYVPWTQRKRGRFLYPAEQVRATDSYFLTKAAAGKMLAQIGQEGFYLPADHLINRLCNLLAIPILWLEPTVVSQGSHTGRFFSMIQPQDRGGLKEKLKWGVKKMRRKYIYPLFGADERTLSPSLRKDLQLPEGAKNVHQFANKS